MPAAAQSSFSDDSHWDPRVRPPVAFVDIQNIETNDDYLIVSGNRPGVSVDGRAAAKRMVIVR